MEDILGSVDVGRLTAAAAASSSRPATATTSGLAEQKMYILEGGNTGVSGQAILLEDRPAIQENENYGLGPDILQQALQEVNESGSTSTFNSNASFDVALSKLLAEQQSQDEEDITPGNPQQILAELVAAAGLEHPVATPSADSVVVASSPLIVQPASAHIEARRSDQLVTVFDSNDGTLKLTPENARALGITTGAVPKSVQEQQKMKVINVKPQDSRSLLVKLPQGNNGKMLLIPEADGSYVLRPKPVSLNITRPTVVGNRIHVPIRPSTMHPPVLTNVLRPVMATGMKSSPRQHPIILPKPVASTNQPKTAPAILSSQPQFKSNPMPVRPALSARDDVLANFVIVDTNNTSANVSENTGPLGTTQNPIQIVHEGKTYRSLQPLNNTQLTSIARELRETRPDFNAKDRKIVYVNEENNTRIEYKILYPEDVTEKVSEKNGPIYFSPEELILPNRNLLNKIKNEGGLATRKRGRPSAMEKVFMKPQPQPNHAKRLCKEFGMTAQQAQAAEKDVVDDSTIEDKDDVDEQKVAMSSSRTRSGRVSRPPIPIDEEFKATNVAPLAKDDVELPAPPTPKVKRNFNVPPKYRCKVCNKIYLGDRKMSRHMKNFSGHGPMAEPPPPKLESDPKKIPTSLSSMPIIPLARTQLEDLVKNLDAELVLDVVSKKMFDNFSMWDLQLKKASLSNQKGLKVLEKLFEDTERVLSELKRLVDNCLTDTKLSDKSSPSLQMGEHLQLALSGHDGPWYLEQPNHLPQEYHGFFGVESAVMASMVSPRSESSNPPGVGSILNPSEIDENTNSLLSGAGSEDKEPSHSGGGAQMVLEQNLGAAMEEDLEDEEETQEDDKLDPKLDPEEEDSNDAKPKPEKPPSPEEKEPAAMERTRLPSFSSIIAGSPKTQLDIPVTTAADLLSDADDHLSIVSGSRRSSIAESRRSSLDHGGFSDDRMIRRSSMDMIHHSGPPSVEIHNAIHPTIDDMMPRSGPPSVRQMVVTTSSLNLSPSKLVDRVIQSMPNSPLNTDAKLNLLDEISTMNSKDLKTTDSTNFLSDLESVLGEPNNFSFNSALNSDNMKRTPELMKSIPPNAMMKPKQDTRTDFMGAFSKPELDFLNTQPTSKPENEGDTLSKLFNDDSNTKN